MRSKDEQTVRPKARMPLPRPKPPALERQEELVGQHDARQEWLGLGADEGNGEDDRAQRQDDQVRPPEAAVDKGLIEGAGQKGRAANPASRPMHEDQERR